MARSHSPGELDDYFKEFEDIESNKEGEEEEETLVCKTPDEGEQEATWLQQAGYGFLVNKYEDGKELSQDEVEALTSPLPSNHRAAIIKRVDTLNATLRKKQKYATKIDVRSIFPQQNAGQKVVFHSEIVEEPSPTASTPKTQPAVRPTTLPRGMKLLSNGDSHQMRKIAIRHPDSHKYVNSIFIEMPRSPVSPRSEVVHPEWSLNRQNRATKGLPGSFVKNKAGYSMSGMSEEVQDNGESGIEMLSLQQKYDFRQVDSQLSPISDSDITFELAVEENGNSPTYTDANLPKSRSSDNLPNYILCEDKLGITHIHDISEADIAYVHSSALLELTSLFDSHNITYSRRRLKGRNKDGGLFGVSLQTIIEQDQKLSPTANIPLVFEAMLKYLLKHSLDTEGIMRIPGSATRVKQLRQELEEKFYHGTFIWADDLTPNDVASLMKQFLRDLPTPLLTEDYLEAFIQIQNLPDMKQQVRALNLLVLVLPDIHRNTLHALLDFLGQVIAHQNTNKMGLSNVSMIMAPNLFMSPKVSKGSRELEFKMAAGTSNIMKMMIKYREILWTVPSALISNVRRQYELEVIRRNKDKTKMKFLAKKDKTEVYKKPALKHESDFQDGVIRVQAPNLTKSSMAFQLSENMTAGDIVSKFRLNEGSHTWDARKGAQRRGDVLVDPRNFTSAGNNTFLYEIGGNIGERCLPNNTNMLALYKVNPNAEWIIRQRTR